MCQVCFPALQFSYPVHYLSRVEVVQRKGEGQAQQPGPLRQGHLRKAVQGSAQL